MPAPLLPVAPSPAAPTLDQLKEEAKKQLGERVSFALIRERYLLIGAPNWSAKGSVSFVERVLTALFTDRFRKDIERPLPIYLFGDDASYNAYCKARYGNDCISIYGFFSPNDYRLVMNLGLGIGTLSHELVHPILDTDFPDAPTWINEGIASLYEAPILPKQGEIHGAKNWRYPQLSAAFFKKKEHTTLPTLFSLSDAQFRDDDESLHYAMARYFCQWMDAHGHLWKFYQSWRDDFKNDPTGEKSFRAVTGKSVAEADKEWRVWVQGL